MKNVFVLSSPSPRRVSPPRGAGILSWLAVAALFTLSGCVAQTDIKQELALIRHEVKQTAGGNIIQNDKWTMRLLGIGVLLLGLSYPIGKIVWISSAAISKRAVRKVNGGDH